MISRLFTVLIMPVTMLFCTLSLFAQYTDHRNRQVDSLEQLLQTNPPTGNVLRGVYHELMWGYSRINSQKSMGYARKGLAASKQINSPYGITEFNSFIAMLHSGASRYDSAMIHYEKALQGVELMKIGKNIQGEPYDERAIANQYSKIYGNMGNLCNTQGKYYEAIECYTKSLKIFDKYNWKESQAIAHSQIGKMYMAMNNYEQAESSYMKLNTLAYEVNDSLLIATANRYLSDLYLQKKEYDRALQKAGIAYEYYFSHPEEGVEKANTLNLLAQIYWNGFGNEKQTEEYARQALVLLKEMDIPREQAVSLRLLSQIHLQRGQWRQAEQTALEAIATDDTEPRNTMALYEILSKTYSYLGKPDKASEYFDKHNALQASWSTKHYQSAIREMEVKYETEKKEARIATLEEEKRLIIWLGIAGAAVLLLALAAFFSLWRLTVQRRRLADQQVKQLEQEKQLIATQALLEGEIQERIRLARDLHDGLGSMLTGARLGFIDVKQNARLEHADMERFDKALGLLDNSTHEMRRVAHHLMPDSLSRFGLKPAVGDFCSILSTVEFIYYGDESRLESNLEVMIYRCIYELVNNALKHAHASQIIVQIMQRPGSIAFTVQDDGCGFDPSATSKGMGLANIRTRVASYNGILNIDSKADEGTEINVELRIENLGDSRSHER